MSVTHLATVFNQVPYALKRSRRYSDSLLDKLLKEAGAWLLFGSVICRIVV